MEIQSPLSIVEFKTGEVRMALFMETPEEVEQITNNAETRLIVLHRWSVNSISEFRTRPDNVIVVRENK